MSIEKLDQGMRDLMQFLDQPKKDIDVNLVQAKCLEMSSAVEKVDDIPIEVFQAMPVEMKKACMQFMLGIVVVTVNDNVSRH